MKTSHVHRRTWNLRFYAQLNSTSDRCLQMFLIRVVWWYSIGMIQIFCFDFVNLPVLYSPHASKVPVEWVESPSRVWKFCHRNVPTNWCTHVFLLSKLPRKSMYFHLYLYFCKNLAAEVLFHRTTPIWVFLSPTAAPAILAPRVLQQLVLPKGALSFPTAGKLGACESWSSLLLVIRHNYKQLQLAMTYKEIQTW